MTTDDHAWLTVPEVARELRVSVPTVWRWIRTGRLAASRIGVRSVRIARAELTGVTTPEAVPARGSGRGALLELETGEYIDLGNHALTPEELLTRLRRHQARMLRSNGGEPFADSVELIREAREEWYSDT